MNKKSVVVTGMGVLTPIGITVEDFWRNSLQGRSGIKTINLFDIPENMSSIAGMIEDFEPDSLDIFKNNHLWDRALLLAKQAAADAVQDANINNATFKKARAAVFLSSAVGQISSMERIYCQSTAKGTQPIRSSYREKSRYNPFLFNSLSGELAASLGINLHLLIPTGCAGGVDAIAYATHAIRSGKYDIAIAGATEAPITPLVVAAFSKIGATSIRHNAMPTKASRPFDKKRDGFVLAEGCGILILESQEHALSRGANIYAEIAGVGSVNNYLHMTDIPQDGHSIAKSCWAAIHDAGIQCNDIDFINAHGSSTPQNDIAETKAFHTIFNGRIKEIPVTSNKSLVGHALSASNAIEVISSILSLNNAAIPPTINVEEQDEQCDLNVVKNNSLKKEINCILKTSSGFSGIHSSLIIQKFKDKS